LIASVALVGVLATLGFASDGSAYSSWTAVTLTAAGPSPNVFTTSATDVLVFWNKDTVAHTLAFTSPDCTFSVPPGYEIGPGGQVINPGQQSLPPACDDNFTFYAGRYSYSMDGKFPGTIEVDALQRSVTLTARTHTIRRGTRLTLHGQVQFGGNFSPACCTPPFPVVIFARYDRGQPLKQIARLRAPDRSWHLRVRPGVRTTYIAQVSGQLPEGQIWTQQPSWSRPFTVLIRD
jgi:hypothetical protein